MKLFRKLQDDPPVAMVIDLSRLPMQGRDVALALRHYKTTRHLSIVLVDGLVDYKICAIDATWSGLLFTRRKAQKNI